jgi:polysaccharide pyruvyl transferase WcaK-like protein
MATNYRACILGAALDTGNLGVSALATSTIGLIRDQRPDAEISLFIGRNVPGTFSVPLGDREYHGAVLNFRLSPRARFDEHLFGILFMALLYRIIPSASFRAWVLGKNARLKMLSESDFIGDIHGGDSFSDIYGLKGMIIGSIPDMIVNLIGKKVHFLPQTYGPYSHWAARYIAKGLIEKGRVVLSRDLEGMGLIRSMVPSLDGADNFRFCPDVAFSLEVRPMREEPVSPAMAADDDTPIVGLNVSGLLYNGGFNRSNMFGLSIDYPKFVNDLAERLLSTRDIRLLLVPHTFAAEGTIESDPDACEKLFRLLQARYPNRVFRVTRECLASEIKSIIGKCDFFIGSRMHACIGALSQGIPTVGLAYSKKFLGVFESVGASKMVIDARSCDSSDTLDAILEMFDQREAARPGLKAEMEGIRCQLHDTFAWMLDSTHGKPS